MTGLSPLQWGTLAAIAAALALAVLWLIDMRARASRTAAEDRSAAASGSSVSHYIFDDGRLIDTDSSASALPPTPAAGETDWQAMSHALSPRFGLLPDTTRAVPEGGEWRDAVHPDDTGRLEMSRTGDCLCVALHDPACRDAGQAHCLRLTGMAQQLQATALAQAPYPAWLMTMGKAEPSWHNLAFTELPSSHRDALVTAAGQLPAPSEERATRRVRPSGDPDDGVCYELSCMTDPETGTRSCHAFDITALSRAEVARREFVQTLTRTFADLRTGLAIFDDGQRLATFNPALTDLTGLPADFLVAHPGLMDFFDRLRDGHRMPEPKDYHDWLAGITRIVGTASGELYQETWPLPGGRTFRVTGRPHPDGAMAFLFEDISDDVSLGRSYRAGMELREAALDHLEEAIALIAPDRGLAFCNAAARRLLGLDPGFATAPTDPDAVLRAAHRCLPDDGFWTRITDSVAAPAAAVMPAAVVHDTAGKRRAVRLHSLPGGSRMLTISPPDAAPEGLSRRTRSADAPVAN